MKRAAAILVMVVGVYAMVADAATLYVGAGQREDSKVFKTISQAVAELASGDVLIIGPGVYRESIDLSQARKLHRQDGAAPRTRIEAAPGAQVTIKGSDVIEGW